MRGAGGSSRHRGGEFDSRARLVEHEIASLRLKNGCAQDDAAGEKVTSASRLVAGLVLDDGGKRFCIQGGAADECAVDLFLAH